MQEHFLMNHSTNLNNDCRKVLCLLSNWVPVLPLEVPCVQQSPMSLDAIL